MSVCVRGPEKRTLTELLAVPEVVAVFAVVVVLVAILEVPVAVLVVSIVIVALAVVHVVRPVAQLENIVPQAAPHTAWLAHSRLILAWVYT